MQEIEEVHQAMPLDSPVQKYLQTMVKSVCLSCALSRFAFADLIDRYRRRVQVQRNMMTLTMHHALGQSPVFMTNAD